MTDEQFNTLNETIKQGLKQIAEESNHWGALVGITDELASIQKTLKCLYENGINTYEQNN